MTACMGLVLLGLRTDEHRETRVYEVKTGAMCLRVSGWHLVFGAVLVCAIPQILYFLSRNFELVWRPGGPTASAPIGTSFEAARGGNCGLPGNEIAVGRACEHSALDRTEPRGFGPALWRTVGAFEPAMQALLWTALLGFLLYLSWGERRVRRLYYSAAWFFAAISTLVRGPPVSACPCW